MSSSKKEVLNPLSLGDAIGSRIGSGSKLGGLPLLLVVLPPMSMFSMLGDDSVLTELASDPSSTLT